MKSILPDNLDQVADMLKAMGHPLRLRMIQIMLDKRLASIPTLQAHLAEADSFMIYRNLRYMQKKHLLKKIRKGREVYYGVSEIALRAGLEAFFKYPGANSVSEPVERPIQERKAVFC